VQRITGLVFPSHRSAFLIGLGLAAIMFVAVVAT